VEVEAEVEAEVEVEVVHTSSRVAQSRAESSLVNGILKLRRRKRTSRCARAKLLRRRESPAIITDRSMRFACDSSRDRSPLRRELAKRQSEKQQSVRLVRVATICGRGDSISSLSRSRNSCIACGISLLHLTVVLYSRFFLFLISLFMSLLLAHFPAFFPLTL
jgi:hypothetical protein